MVFHVPRKGFVYLKGGVDLLALLVVLVCGADRAGRVFMGALELLWTVRVDVHPARQKLLATSQAVMCVHQLQIYNAGNRGLTR